MKHLVCLLALLLGTGVAQAQEIEPTLIPEGEVFKVIERLMPVNYHYSKPRRQEVDTVVFHSICSPVRTAIGGYQCNPDSKNPYDEEDIIRLLLKLKVSAHYLIARDGTVYQLVSESRIAYHAGESRMPGLDGRQSVNRFSIGIEIINMPNDEPTEEQYFALASLMQDIRIRHNIVNKVSHDEIAGKRRSDPYNFRWELAADW